MSDNEKSLNDSNDNSKSGLEIDFDELTTTEYCLGDEESELSNSDNQVQLLSNNSSPGFVAVVPVIEINTENSSSLAKNHQNIKAFKKNSKKVINQTANILSKMNNIKNECNLQESSSNNQFDSGYSMRDINSTTNLLGLDESSMVNNEAYLNVPNSNHKYSFKTNGTNSNTILINAGFNSNSQSSFHTNNRFSKDVDSIPLVRLTSKLLSIY
jgi:hypothetical protein